MSTVQEQLEKLYTLLEGFDAISKKQIPALADKIDNIKLPEIDTSAIVDAIASRSVKYDKQTGNLTIENVQLTINE